MELTLSNGETFFFRSYKETDFNEVQQLNRDEGWTNLVSRGKETENAWHNSNIKFVVGTKDEKAIIGYVRGLTDQHITLYICELLIKDGFRGLGIGRELLHYVHGLYPDTRMELLASSSSHTYYEQLGFRNFPGFRKTLAE